MGVPHGLDLKRGLCPMNTRNCLLLFLGVLFLALSASYGFTQEALGLPSVRLEFGQASSPKEVATTLEIFFLLTVLSLGPSIVIMLTSFTRIVVVLSILRQAIGVQQTPPNQVLVGIALFLTFFLMAPVWGQINDRALQPYLREEIGPKEATDMAIDPVRKFMFSQTRKKDLGLMLNLAKHPKPKNSREVPTRVLIPAFIISELKSAFQIGFMFYIPFLVIDMIVASVLLAMGMLMLPPVIISLPFKLMLFVLVDGWNIVADTLIRSFGP